MPVGFEINYLPYSPAADPPEFTYFNTDGTFELNRSTGTATYVWPPAYHDDGSPRDNSNLTGYRDILEFVAWANVTTPSGTDEGWVYKVKDEPFWFMLGTDPRTFAPGNHSLWTNTPLYRFFYSTDGQFFLRWRTIQGTRRCKLERAQDPQISTPVGDVSQQPNSPSTSRRIDLGRYKKTNGWRLCPGNVFQGDFHPLGDTRDEWIKLWIDIDFPNVDDIIDDVKECAKIAAGAELTAAVVTDGASLSAAGTTFIQAFKVCINSKIGQLANQLNVSFQHDTESGEWSGDH